METHRVVGRKASVRSHAGNGTGAHLLALYKWLRTCPPHDIPPHARKPRASVERLLTLTNSSAMDTLHEERPAMKAHEYRKIVKPLLERRRRARINSCLMELKNLLAETNSTLEGTEASRLEKADILELTVKHLKDSRNWHRRPSKDSAEFRLGFTECASEIAACITTLPGISLNVRNQLINHLTGRQGSPTRIALNAPTPPPSPRTPTHPLDLTAKEEHIQDKIPTHWRPW